MAGPGGLEDIQFNEVGIKARGSDIEGCWAVVNRTGQWLGRGNAEHILS